jgi:hypothetical protein
MTRTRWRAGLGAIVVVLLALAGCDTLGKGIDWDVVTRVVGPDPAREHVVAGSQATVASSAQTALEHLGLSVVPTWEKDDIHLNTYTKSGQQLTVVVSRQLTDAGEHALLRFDWEGVADESLETRLLNHIEVRTKP